MLDHRTRRRAWPTVSHSASAPDNLRLRRLYRIENDIPLMLPKLAVPVSDEEHNRLMKCARRGEVTTITVGQADVLADDPV